MTELQAEGGTALRVALLVNPASGKGRGSSAAAKAERRLRERGAEVYRHQSASAAEMKTLAVAAYKEQIDVLAIVGGDGTLAMVINELCQGAPDSVLQLPIALIPAGTGNDFARALGIPYEGADAATRAADLALSGKVRRVDLGEASCPDGHAYFLTVAALGFDAFVSERTNRLRWPRGAARYYLALLLELLRLRVLQYRIRAGDAGETVRPGIVLAVGNTSSYGGGMPICSGADASDALLDLTHISPLGRWKFLRLFPLLLRAAHLARAEVHTARFDEAHISAPGLVVYADGERVGTGSVTLRAVPAALPMLLAKESQQ